MGTVPTPPTFAAGDKAGVAANLNTIRDSLNFLMLPPQCYVYQTTATTFTTSGTYTLCNFDTELYDTDGIHSTVTNTSRLVVQTPGKYIINAQAVFAANATGRRGVQVRLNAAGAFGGGTFLVSKEDNAQSSGTTVISHQQIMISMVAGDYIEVFGMQSSGGSLAGSTGQGGTFCQIRWSST